MKPCPGCGDVKPLDGFYRRSGSADLYVTPCKECKRAYGRRPEVRARDAERKRNPEHPKMDRRKHFVKRGQRFGLLTVIDPLVRDHRGQLAALCQCDCGKQVTVLRYNLPNGNSKSCGCKKGCQPRQFVKPGQRFGRGVVLDPDAKVPARRGARLTCDCGGEYVSSIAALLSGATQSCGCLRLERFVTENRLSPVRVERLRAALMGRPRPDIAALHTTHGLSRHPLYQAWAKMMKRCHDEHDRAYRNYGGRGIQVYEPWHDVRSYIAWGEANLGSRPGGLTAKGWPEFTLDRTDNDGNYEPGNVQWADWTQQRVNQRPKMGSLKELIDLPDTDMECPACGETVTSERAFDRHYAKAHKRKAAS